MQMLISLILSFTTRLNELLNGIIIGAVIVINSFINPLNEIQLTVVIFTKLFELFKLQLLFTPIEPI